MNLYESLIAPWFPDLDLGGSKIHTFTSEGLSQVMNVKDSE